MTHTKMQTLIVGLLCVAIVLMASIGGYLVMNAGRTSTPPAAQEEHSAAPAELPMTVAPRTGTPEILAMGNWLPQRQGCVIEQMGTKFHFFGTSNQEDYKNWNGVTASGRFPLGNFDVSADFMAPKFEGQGNAAVFWRAKTNAANNQLGIRYDARAGIYRLQGWQVGANPRYGDLTVKQFGDEATAFHRMRLKYDAATHEATGWIDDTPLGNIAYELKGAIQFEMALNSEHAGNQIDVYFDHFALLMGERVVVPPPSSPPAKAL